MFNIQKSFEEKLELIQIKRNKLKYKSGSDDYPKYLVKEIFRYHYGMQNIWDVIMSYANQDFPCSAADAYDALFSELESSINEIDDKIDSLLLLSPNEWVGAIRYSGFTDLIELCSYNDRKAREELEFSFLYYILSDLCTLYWAANCASGLSKLDSVRMITGYIIQPMPLNDYKVIVNGLGKLFVSRYLEQNYTPLP